EETAHAEAGVARCEGYPEWWSGIGPEGDAIRDRVDEHRGTGTDLEVGGRDGPGLDTKPGLAGYDPSIAGEYAASLVAFFGGQVTDQQEIDIGVLVKVAARLGAEEEGAGDGRVGGGKGAVEESLQGGPFARR